MRPRISPSSMANETPPRAAGLLLSREALSAGGLAQPGQAVAHAERRFAPHHRHLAADHATAARHQHLASLVEADPVPAGKQGAESGAIEIPVTHRAGVDMHEAGVRVPANPAALHRASRLHRLGELVAKMHVEGAAINMLAVF